MEMEEIQELVNEQRTQARIEERKALGKWLESRLDDDAPISCRLCLREISETLLRGDSPEGM